MMEFINFYFIPGLTLGGIYALGAVGISMIFGILRFAHFAHGDMLTVGAYAALTVVWFVGIPALGAIPIAILFTCLVALAMDRVFYKPLRALPTIYTVISSFGVALILRSAVQLIWGTDSQVYATGFQRPIVLFDSLLIATRHAQIIGATIVIAVLLHLFLTHTRTGKSMRAVSDDPQLARVAGLDPEKVVRWCWIIGASLAAIAGVFVGLDTDVHTNLGWNLLLPMFAAAILGGIGRPLGAMAGGMIIGLAEELCTYPLFGEPLLPASYKTAVAFLIMVGLLIFRPQGLFKGRLL